MSIEHWIIIYLFINAIICYLGSDGEFDYEPAEAIICAVIGAVFAIPIVCINYGYAGGVWIVKWLDGLIQFRTYWYYVFNRIRLIASDHELIQSLYKWGLENRSGKSIGHRLWRHAQGLIHKVNKYTPER